LGGNKITITAKTINHFIDNVNKIGWDKDNINKYFTDMVKDCPEYEYKPVKKKINDEFLCQLIKEMGTLTPKTTILKNISSKGFACGPNRLSRILNKLNK